MNLDLRRVDPRSRVILEGLLQLELYEIGMDPGLDGLIDWGESLDRYFADPEPNAFFFVVDDRIVGFALVKLIRASTPPEGYGVAVLNLVSEFYVARPWRRKGIGTCAAHMLFDRYPGQWAITSWPDGLRVRFWRHVTSEYRRGKTQEFSPGEHKGFPGQYVWIVGVRGENTTAYR